MTKEELSKMGHELADKLEALLPHYHVKSDEHTVIAWESSILRAKSKVLIEGGELIDALTESVLLSKGGAGVAKRHGNLSESIASFHHMFNEIMGE